MTACACAASCDDGSAAITFSNAVMVAALSPLFSSTSASLKSGLPHVGSAVLALVYHSAAFGTSHWGWNDCGDGKPLDSQAP